MVILVVTTTGQGDNPIYCWWRLVIFSQLGGFQAVSGMFTPILAEYVRLDEVLVKTAKCLKPGSRIKEVGYQRKHVEKRHDCVFVVSAPQTNKKIWHRGIWLIHGWIRYTGVVVVFPMLGKGLVSQWYTSLVVHKFTSAVAWWNRKQIHKSTLY